MSGKVITHGSLFSGIGGFDLAAHWMGWHNVFNCETDNFCRHVLSHYFPHSIGYGDIKETNFKRHRGKISVLSGGFPCQPFSIAGKRLGKEDERHLWPHMLRAVLEIRPAWVVGENVRGIISWNEGLVFEEVHADLEAAGYEVQAFVLPAAGINAPHQRQRVWFIAHAVSIGGGARLGSEAHPSGWETEEHFTQRRPLRDKDPATGGAGTTPNTFGLRCGAGGGDRRGGHLQRDQGPTEKGQQEREVRQRGPGKAGTAPSDPGGAGRQRAKAIGSAPAKGAGSRPGKSLAPRRGRGKNWEDFPQTEPTIRCGDDGLPGPVDAAAIFSTRFEALAGIAFNKWRVESIKAYGNAIVPQLAYRVFKTIASMMK